MQFDLWPKSLTAYGLHAVCDRKSKRELGISIQPACRCINTEKGAMFMKKKLSLALAMLLSVSMLAVMLAGCGGGRNSLLTAAPLPEAQASPLVPASLPPAER